MNPYRKMKDYLEKARQQRHQSFWNTIPLTQIEWFPKSSHEWLYGYTYLSSKKIALREDLQGNYAKKEETDIHESLHTNNEYETRKITEWILKILRGELEPQYQF